MLKQRLFDLLDAKSHEIIKMRRELHRFPEPSFGEFETARYIMEFYTGKDIEWLRHPVGKNGVAARISGGAKVKSGKTLAIRADFDALPINEETGLPFGSRNPGFMHACGHDGHTAVLLALADALIQSRKDLPGDVVVIHQYGEETPPGGAKAMIEDGVLEGVDAIVGGHLWAPYDTGEIAVCPGLAMAGRTYFKVTLVGRGGHGSQPQRCVDPIVAASHFVVAAQSIVGRNIDPVESAVVSFGRFEGLGSFNVIPNSVMLEGDVRSCTGAVSGLVEKRFREMLSGIAAAYGCTYELVYQHDYPPVCNDVTLAELAVEVVGSDVKGGLSLRRGELTMGSEDFSYYQQKIPGLYVFFGARPKNPETNPEKEVFPHHHPKFDIDEGSLLGCAKFFAGFAAGFFEKYVI